MKNQSYKRIAAALAILMSGPLLSGCGSSEPDPAPAAPVAPAAPAAIAPGIAAAGMCVPISSQIGFTGTGIYFDSANIYGGMVPGMQQFGQMTVGTGSAGGPLMRSGVDGTISMNVTPIGAGAAPGMAVPNGMMMQPGASGGQTSATGFVQISPQTQQDIMYQAQIGRIPVGAGMGMMPGAVPGAMPMAGAAAPTSLCVSGIAMNLGHYYNTIHSGHVYLYMNNSQHGYKLYF